MNSVASRRLITAPPFAAELDRSRPPYVREQYGWPFRWIAIEGSDRRPWVAAYRCAFVIKEQTQSVLHVTADERYELYLDGTLIGRGSERGDRNHWFYETYALDLAAGEHMLVARVWSLGKLAPWAQATVCHGLLVAPQDPALAAALGTGVAPWTGKCLKDCEFTDVGKTLGMGVGPAVTVVASREPGDFRVGGGDDWRDVIALHPGNNGFYHFPFVPVHLLRPATLPAMVDRPIAAIVVRTASDGRADAWSALLAGREPVTLPAHTAARVLIDLDNYYCYYPELEVSGGSGATLNLTYAEALHPKDNRDTVEGKSIQGLVDGFVADGRDALRFDTLWWRCGRYVALEVRTAAVPLVIRRLAFQETRYPLEMGGTHASDDPRLDRALDVGFRTLQVCCHETFMDCPHYEQLMYVGDTRIQCLVAMVTSRDDRPIRKALRMFDASRLNFNRTTTSAYPPGGHLIPPFSLWWIAMIHDFATFRGEREFVRTLLPGARSVAERFWEDLDPQRGVMKSPLGWNFVDAAPAPFHHGIPPGAIDGFNACLNLQLLLALQQLATLEEYVGEPELATRFTRWTRELAPRIREVFLDETRGLVRETPGEDCFSEHAQCLAIACGLLEGAAADRLADGLFDAKDLTPCTVYFSHYLFDAAFRMGRPEEAFRRLAPWKELPELGYRTLPENFGGTRSDCHAWSAHPLYHFHTGILGVQPVGFGFESVRVAPQLGPLEFAEAHIPHPKGMIHVWMRREGGNLSGGVILPTDVSGHFVCGGRTVELGPGRNLFVRHPA